MRRCHAVGGVGVRRVAALTLIVFAVALMALGFALDPKAAVLTLTGVVVAVAVVFVDVDKLTGRG